MKVAYSRLRNAVYADHVPAGLSHSRRLIDRYLALLDRSRVGRVYFGGVAVAGWVPDPE